MKKALYLIIAALILLTFISCSSKNGENGKDKDAETTPAPLPKVGDTVNGELFDFTLDSAQFVDSIPRGLLYYYGAYEYKPVTAKPGYTIIQIDLSLSYKGKAAMKFPLDISLDFDNGYVFTTDVNGHAEPEEAPSAIPVSVYTFNGRLIDISDPLSFGGVKGTFYFFVNDSVKTETNKPLVLKVTLPTNDDNTTTETFTFNIR